MQTDDYVSLLKSDFFKSSGTFRVLVGVTGSVAALKLPTLVSQLLQLPGVDVRVVTTEHAKHFYNPAEVSVKIYSDKDEWEHWTQRSDPVLHIELRRWADLLVIAPLDANTLGKIASGICDNLLTCVVRAWDTSQPLLFCPAMNTAMWLHPITAQQVSRLKEFGYVEIPCIAKKLVCGDEVATSCRISTNHCPAGFRRFPTATHVTQITGSLKGLCKTYAIGEPFHLEGNILNLQDSGPGGLELVVPGIGEHYHLKAGKGAMAEVSTIVSVVKQYLQKADESSQKA